jgi:hypothetical protein
MLRRSVRRSHGAMLSRSWAVLSVQKGDQMSIPTFKELRESTDEKLIENIRNLSSITHVAGVGSEAVEGQIYLNELVRRDQEKETGIIVRYTKVMVRYTKYMTVMTGLMLVLTVILVVRDFLVRAH